MKKLLVCLSFLSCAYAEKVYDSSVDDSDLFKKDDPAFIFDGEFLYWTADTNPLDYAIKMNEAAWSASSNYAKGTYEVAKYGWNPGVRATLGYFNAPKYWEFRAQYTWIKITGSDNASKPETANQYLNATWPDLLSTYLTGAHSKLKLTYNVADLLAARVFVPNNHLRIRMLGGFTGSLIKNNWNINYFSVTNESALTNKWRYLAIGLRLGMTLDWFWGKDFYLTALASAASYMGRYKNHSKQTSNEAIDSGDITLAAKNSYYKDYRSAFETQVIFGPSYQRSFSCSRFEFFVGYELTNWFNLQEIFRSSSGAAIVEKETYESKGTLALQGLVARFTANF